MKCRFLRLSTLTAIVAALALMAVAGLSGVAAQTQEEPIPTNGSWTICHYTNENAQHLYNKITPNLSSFTGANGHFQHDNGADIIPPFWYMDGNTATYFDGLNWDAAGQARFSTNDCSVPTPELPVAVLENPVVVDGCAPSITLPANSAGITYSQDVAAAPGATVTVSATLNSQTHKWGVTDGWLPNPPGAATVLTKTFTFSNPDCRAELTPLSPVVTQATCEAPASLQLPVGPTGITYSVSGEVAPGNTVTVTATITDPAAYKMAMLADPWTRVSDTEATQSVTFTVPKCPRATDVPGETPSPSPTVTPTSTVPPTVTPTSTVPPTVTETPTATVPPTVTVPPTGTVPPTATVAPKPVTSLPDTGSGQDAIGSGLLILASAAALAVIALGVNRSKKA